MNTTKEPTTREWIEKDVQEIAELTGLPFAYTKEYENHFKLVLKRKGYSEIHGSFTHGAKEFDNKLEMIINVLKAIRQEKEIES